MLQGERKKCYRECQNGKRREFHWYAPWLQVYRSPGKCGRWAQSRVLPEGSSDLQRCRCHHSICQLGHTSISLGKNLSRDSLCAAAAGKSHEASFPAKKNMHFSLCSMMGAVVPWPGQRAPKSHFRAVAAASVLEFGLLGGREQWSSSTAPSATWNHRVEENSPPSKGDK